LAEWQQLNEDISDISDRMQVTQHALSQRDTWEARLADFRQSLPRHAADKEVTAELLKNLEQTAREHGLILLRREPDQEKSLGDLYEVAIHCTWEGQLDALVHFLYAIQVQGAILDIRQLTVTPTDNSPNQLKGSFTVDHAYSREQGGSE
jgi:Tfp pilus assembly protein PilO